MDRVYQKKVYVTKYTIEDRYPKGTFIKFLYDNYGKLCDSSGYYTIIRYDRYYDAYSLDAHLGWTLLTAKQVRQGFIREATKEE